MTYNQLLKVVLEHFPNATIGYGRNMQLVIFTNLQQSDDSDDKPLEEMQDAAYEAFLDFERSIYPGEVDSNKTYN